MSFKVSITQYPVVWDTLPVAKLICYPFSQDAYRPFSQAQICFVPDRGIYARLWSFEAVYRHREKKPQSIFKDSCMSLCLGVSKDHYLRLTWNANAVMDGLLYHYLGKTMLLDREQLSDIHPFTGEDLQGEYWGVEFLISNHLLHQLFPDASFEKDTLLMGNVFCTRMDGEKDHFGCLYQCENQQKGFDSHSFGEFVVVDY